MIEIIAYYCKNTYLNNKKIIFTNNKIVRRRIAVQVILDLPSLKNLNEYLINFVFALTNIACYYFKILHIQVDI